MPRIQCPTCFRPPAYCYCSRIQKTTNNWPVFILQDVREARHPIGTARIAALSLSEAELVTLDPDKPDPAADLLSKVFSRPLKNPALIYPGDAARPIHDLHAGGLPNGQPRDLLFIDANWGRSLRMMKVFPALSPLPQFVLTGLPISRYRIRKQPSTDTVSTLEAVVCTLQQVEPAQDFTAMLATMDWMIGRQIERMGDEVYQHNYGAE